MSLHTIQISEEIAVSQILSYLSLDFSQEIEKRFPAYDYCVQQLNQSSSYTNNGSVIMTTKLVVELTQRELLQSA